MHATLSKKLINQTSFKAAICGLFISTCSLVWAPESKSESANSNGDRSAINIAVFDKSESQENDEVIKKPIALNRSFTIGHKKL